MYYDLLFYDVMLCQMRVKPTLISKVIFPKTKGKELTIVFHLRSHSSFLGVYKCKVNVKKKFNSLLP